EYLFTQLARADYIIEINEINNLAHRLIRVLTVELAKLVIKSMALEQSFQYLVSALDATRLHGKLHRPKYLEALERLQHCQCQKNEQRKNNRHVPASNAGRESNSKTNEQHRRLFGIANVRAETNERRSRENSKRARGTVAHNHHHRTRNYGHENLRLGNKRIAPRRGNTASRTKSE